MLHAIAVGENCGYSRGTRYHWSPFVSNRTLMIAGIVAGIFFIAVGIMYFVTPAKSLPLPDFLGHQSGSNHHHTKHGIAALVVALACFAFAWFQSGPRTEQPAPAGPER